jgi:error-prone DNA polymerase
MNILPKLKPVCFYDIIVSIAIVRPGPIQGNIIHPYLRRRRGEEEVIYLHPSLEPILKRTLGVPLFQEQGMKLAVTAAGFTASQADQLRKVMSHKRSKEKMAKLCGELSAGMKKNGFSETAIETITHQLQAFANYGFPESHAASFSLLVYASAYLKRYYPVEFCCAILNAQPMGFYSPASLIRDAVRHGVEVRPVDLAHSLWHCTLEPLEPLETLEPSTNTLGFAVRLGLRFVDGLGPASQAALAIALQDEKGLFKSVEDVVSRSGFHQVI